MMWNTTNMVVDHNGSPRHKLYKGKMANLLRSVGFKAAGDNDDEFAITRHESENPYYVDVCASNDTRDLVIEIHGYEGHNSRRRILHDKNRANEIKALVHNIEYYEFSFWQLKDFEEMTPYILEELGIA